MQPTPRTPATPETQVPPFERHYMSGELARLWHMSRTKVTELFIVEPGVIKFGESKLRRGRKHPYVSLRIPESVAWRVYRRLSK
jgi:hypothetical protein